jgi:hypothetical protein
MAKMYIVDKQFSRDVKSVKSFVELKVHQQLRWSTNSKKSRKKWREKIGAKKIGGKKWREIFGANY